MTERSRTAGVRAIVPVRAGVGARVCMSIVYESIRFLIRLAVGVVVAIA